ncbi:MAG: type II secretion system GspH family protein [Synergistaceae bacterium]|jgi:prepilin-type N-terminal cleavage/methylation domain-containing protein|nr:type II secretion system GspH family protein [Synergistaceae bacterium]
MRAHSSRHAFTLIEILAVVALTGLISSLALAPVVYAVRQVVETEAVYSDEAALRRTAVFMAQEVAAGLRLASVVVRVVDHKQLGGGDDDTLIIASAAPAKQNLAAGSVVYKVVRPSFMNEKYIPGLYRWLLPGVLPEDAEYDNLEEEDGQLVAPYVTELRVSVLEPPEWVDDYSGELPPGMRFALSRTKERQGASSSELDAAERVEYVFGFPQ